MNNFYRFLNVALLMLLSFFGSFGQNNDLEINTEFANKMNFTFQNIEKNRVPYGILKDFAFEFTELGAYNGVVNDSNYVTPLAFRQMYNTLLMGRIHNSANALVAPEVLEQRLAANRRAKQITLSGLAINYATFRTDAVTANRLRVQNNQFYDKYVNGNWQDPYQINTVVGIAPSVRTYKGFAFNVQLPQELWFSNNSQSLDYIQVDADDGLGVSYDWFRAEFAGRLYHRRRKTMALQDPFYKRADFLQP